MIIEKMIVVGIAITKVEIRSGGVNKPAKRKILAIPINNTLMVFCDLGFSFFDKTNPAIAIATKNRIT
ncbi:MAG: hypothetical protein P8Q14_10500 [Vicingaceae bacterium]|nr:hypothetical protein [Vicingaceae bacterium]